MTITDRLRPHIREAAHQLARGELVGLCDINHDLQNATPDYAVLRTAILERGRHPTSTVWRSYPLGRLSGYVALNLLPSSMTGGYPCYVVWPRVVKEHRIIGALRWYRWAVRTCQLADRMKESTNASL